MAKDSIAFARNSIITAMNGNTFGGEGNIRDDFSIIKFVKNKGGRVLFIEYDECVGEALATTIGLLIDLAMMTVMSNGELSGSGYFILDELQLIRCDKIEDAASFMNGQNGCILCATQSHSGLYHRYGEHKANSIISCCSSLLFFQCNDIPARNYFKELCGKTVVETLSTSGFTFTKDITTQYIVDDAALTSLQTGEAIVRIPNEVGYAPPFIFKFDEYKKRG